MAQFTSLPNCQVSFRYPEGLSGAARHQLKDSFFSVSQGSSRSISQLSLHQDDSQPDDSPMFIGTPTWVKAGLDGDHVEVEHASFHPKPRFVSIYASLYGGLRADPKTGRASTSGVDSRTFLSARTEVSAVGVASHGKTPMIPLTTTGSIDSIEGAFQKPPPTALPIPSFVSTGASSALGSSPSPTAFEQAAHAAGTCKPCAHFWRAIGCWKGDQCERCHVCSEQDFRKYREAYRKSQRAQRRVRRSAEQSQ